MAQDILNLYLKLDLSLHWSEFQELSGWIRLNWIHS